MPALSVSTWSLHRRLGTTYPQLELTNGEREAAHPYGPGTLTLLDTPAAVADLGITNLEFVHFHFPRTDADYLAALRDRLDAAGVAPSTLLIDSGDITAADDAIRDRDLARIKAWIDVAATLGARRARIVAGEARPGNADAVARSTGGLSVLADYGASLGVRVITENWRQLAMDPATLLTILDGLGDRVGLCADTGNYKGPGKYDDLRRILPRAETIHAKADYPAAGQMDDADFRRCLDLARATGFDGDYVLIFDGPGDELASLAEMAEVARPYL
jgi:sugar phosphate isomerase/epimerase